MKAICILGVAAALSFSDVAYAEDERSATWQGELDQVLTREGREWFFELGINASVVGQCERLLGPGQADQFVDSLREVDIDGRPGTSETDRLLRPLILDAYAAGRGEASRTNATPGQCERAILKSQALLRQAGDRWKAANQRPE